MRQGHTSRRKRRDNGDSRRRRSSSRDNPPNVTQSRPRSTPRRKSTESPDGSGRANFGSDARGGTFSKAERFTPIFHTPSGLTGQTLGQSGRNTSRGRISTSHSASAEHTSSQPASSNTRNSGNSTAQRTPSADSSDDRAQVLPAASTGEVDVPSVNSAQLSQRASTPLVPGSTRQDSAVQPSDASEKSESNEAASSPEKQPPAESSTSGIEFGDCSLGEGVFLGDTHNKPEYLSTLADLLESGALGNVDILALEHFYSKDFESSSLRDFLRDASEEDVASYLQQRNFNHDPNMARSLKRIASFGINIVALDLPAPKNLNMVRMIGWRKGDANAHWRTELSKALRAHAGDKKVRFAIFGGSQHSKGFGQNLFFGVNAYQVFRNQDGSLSINRLPVR